MELNRERVGEGGVEAGQRVDHHELPDHLHAVTHAGDVKHDASVLVSEVVPFDLAAAERVRDRSR